MGPGDEVESSAAYVSANDSESLLVAVAAGAANPIAGIYGPESLSWRVNRESALFLGAGRAALLQLAHPWVTAALGEHSRVMNRPIARFHSTFRIVFTMIFGSLEQALAAARHLHALHTRIRGLMPEDVGSTQRWSKARSWLTNARSDRSRQPTASNTMPKPKPWPRSSAFPRPHCLRIGKPSRRTTGRCTMQMTGRWA